MGTKIQWTDATLNTITGCTKYSEGCKNCYAARMHKRLTAMGQQKYKEPFNKVVVHPILSELKKRITKNTKMCFVNSMSDTFHAEVPEAYIYSLLQAVGMHSETNFQILTKRAKRLPKFEYPDNVWLGVTVEAAQYKNRIDELKKTNAKIKFLSCEPLLDDLGELDLSGIDWVIVGGESGCGARPCNPNWVRNIQRQCKEQNVAFFFKQWGEWQPIEFKNGLLDIKPGLNVMFTDPSPSGALQGSMKVGTKKAGSLLDGVEYKEYPKAANLKDGE